ncbi:hypothetical protein GCAAIG_07145 [Candidatus Electronema halotolerans]
MLTNRYHIIFETATLNRGTTRFCQPQKNSESLNIRASELQNKNCYESATTTKEFVNKALLETYGKNANLLDYVLIITAVNNNGIFPDNKPRNISIAYELDKFSDAFFGNAGNTEWFLKTDRAEDIAVSY